jgi:hydrogenase expression/formation protein HypC
MQITRIDGFDARCAIRGVERDVSLFMLQGEDVAVGDYVLVHVGYAIQRLSAEEAAASWELFDQILDDEAVSGA